MITLPSFPNRMYCRAVGGVLGDVCSNCKDGCDPDSPTPPVGGSCPLDCSASEDDDDGDGGGRTSAGQCLSHAQCAAEADQDPELQGMPAYCGEITISAMMGNGNSEEPVTACW